MSKHTPGPWYYETTATVYDHDRDCQIADCAPDGETDLPFKVQQANARLIAEVPALLVELRANTEVLTKVLSAIDADELPYLHAIVRASVTSSTEAIAKAEDRSE